MNKAQRLLLTLFSLLLLAATLALVVQNWSISVPVHFFSWHEDAMSLGSLLGASGLILAIGAGLLMWLRLTELNQAYKKTNRELERKDVSREEATEKVKVLENKIITLEKALSEALKLN